MQFSSYIDEFQKVGGSSAWAIHGQARARARAGEDILVLSIGDHDFDTPTEIVDSAVAALRAGRHHYAGPIGIPELRQAITGYHKDVIGEEIKAENVAVLPGAQNGVFTAAMTVLNPGDEIITFDPMYITYAGAFLARHAIMKPVPLRPENNFQPDPAEVAAAITPKTRAIMVNSPTNPTGAVFTREVLEAMAKMCIEHDLWMISDEVYSTLTFEREHISPRRIDGMAERTISIYSLSKSHAMTGWRLGWIVASEEAIRMVEPVTSSMLFGTATFLQDAMLTAVGSAAHVKDDIRDIYRKRRDTICDALKGVPKVKITPPDAGMFLMIDIRDTGMGSIEFAQGLLDDQALALLPGEGFGKTLEGHLRLSYSVEPEILEDAARRVSRFIQKAG